MLVTVLRQRSRMWQDVEYCWGKELAPSRREMQNSSDCLQACVCEGPGGLCGTLRQSFRDFL